MKTLFNKNKRGFSLVELMVVVAIMGTLASIAIPAFNEYRKSAKKNAYRADLSSMHKGWLAFGVELDSFCERETAPTEASIQNIGMEPILSSKLYGGTTGSCSETGITQANCTGKWDHDGDPTNPDISRVWSPGSGNNKENFIGFGDINANCQSANQSPPVNPANAVRSNPSTTPDSDCTLDVAEYKMGVFGHVGATDYIGYSITDNGVVTENEGDQSLSWLASSQVDHSCT